MTAVAAEPETLLTLAEAAARSGLTSRTWARWARLGLVSARRVGLRKWMVPETALAAVMTGQMRALAK